MFSYSELKTFSNVTRCIPNSLDTKHKWNLQKTFNLCSMSLGGLPLVTVENTENNFSQMNVALI